MKKMPQTQVKPLRNQSIECARLAASFCVVFIHCPFPGRSGELLACMGRFAVPLFFVISGFFSFEVPKETLRKRVRHLLWLNVLATIVYALWRCAKAAYDDADLWTCLMQAVPTAEEWTKWALVSDNPFAGHLWYLTSILVCSLALLGYVCFFGQQKVSYRGFYGACGCLFALQLILGELAAAMDMPVPYMLYRNALLLGLPMFGMGVFLGQYRRQLAENFHLTDGTLLILILAGMGLSLVCELGGAGVDLPTGMVLAVAALMLLMVSHPQVTKNRLCAAWIARFRGLSTTVYILHLMVVEIYGMFLQGRFEAVLGSREDNLRPLVVLGITLAAALLWEGMKNVKRHSK